MSLRRTFDPAFLNRVANDPSVRPWLGMDRASWIEFTPLLSDHRNVALVNAHGGFVFASRGTDEYEVHTLFLPSGRGKQAIRAAKQAVAFMFVNIGANRIVTDAPEDNPAAFGLARLTGFRVCGERRDAGGVLTGKDQIVREMELTRSVFFKAARASVAATLPFLSGRLACQ